VIKISNLTRLCLLRRYGGLWTDATVFCLRPLDDWLDDAYDAGFFAFRNPAKDRMLATWLIASEPDNPLLVALHAAFLDFVNRRSFSNQNTAFGRYVLARLTPVLRKDVRRTTLWLNPLVQSVLRAYPYFFFHYLFNRLILTRPTRAPSGSASARSRRGRCTRCRIMPASPTSLQTRCPRSSAAIGRCRSSIGGAISRRRIGAP